MSADYVTVALESLLDFTTACFLGVGMPEMEAGIGAWGLVRADLRGVETHGVCRLADYVHGLQTGHLNPKPEIRIVQETPATIVVDGDRGLGHVVSAWVMDRCIEKAGQAGAAFAVARNSGHNGAVGLWALQPAERGMIGLAACTGGIKVPPTYGAEALTGLNPLAIAAPAVQGPPFMMDICTSVVAGGKLMMASLKGESIPRGWALDQDLQPTTDPKAAMEGLSLPLGSRAELASHKGYALSLALEFLCNTLASLPTSVLTVKDPEVPSTMRGQFFGAVNIASFVPVGQFEQELGRTLQLIRESKKLPGAERIFTPGEKEHELEQRQRKEGVSLYRGTFEHLGKLAAELGLRPPRPAESA